MNYLLNFRRRKSLGKRLPIMFSSYVYHALLSAEFEEDLKDPEFKGSYICNQNHNC